MLCSIVLYCTVLYYILWHCTVLYCTIQYNTIQYNIIQYNTIQYNTIQYNTIQYNTIQYNTIQYNTIQYNTIQYNTIQYNTIQYNTIQYNTIQYNTIQYNTIQYNTIQYNTMYVYIGRAKSQMKPVYRGVPQGSVLGPLLYLAYTNNMTEAIRNENCQNQVDENTSTLFGNNCEHCGVLAIYADDATYCISNRHRNLNQQELSENIIKIGNYLNSNELVINMDKTKLTECMIKQNRGKLLDNHQNF